MAPAARWLFFLCPASFFWSFTFGLNAPLASLWMKNSGASETLIGLNTGSYYLGIALASVFVPRLMRRGGYGCLLVGMIGTAVTAAAFPWGRSLTGWFLLHGAQGVAGAMSLIPLETYVNRHSAPERRAENFGYYAFCIALGMALGALLGLQMSTSRPRAAFLIGGSASLFGAVVVAVWKPPFPGAEESHGRTPLEFARNSLSFGSAWSQGFLEGGMLGLLPIYLLAVGLNEAAVSWLMSGLMIGIIAAQVPVAWLADRLGRTRVLLGCNVVALVGMGCLLVPSGVAWMAFWLFAVGACSGAFYPLGLALLGERVPPAGLARANAWYLSINCAGSMTGPVAAGAAMEWFGSRAMFLAGAVAVVFVLVTSAGLRLGLRGSPREVAAGAAPAQSRAANTAA